jgi:small subunit ribosomal protein S35
MPEYSVELLTKEQRSMYDLMSPEERRAFDEENNRLVAEFNDPVKRAAVFNDLEKRIQQIDKEEDLRFEDIRPRHPGFWAEDEPDELAQVEDGDEEINDDEMTSLAHQEVEMHREMREYARLTAWDMPMLSSKLKCHPVSACHLLISVYRARTTIHPAPRHPHSPLPLHFLHG